MTENQNQTTFNQYALPVGTRLKHYVIEKLLGQGGFGLVYLARDESLACQVAIKEYLPEQLASRTQGNTVSPNSENTQASFTLYRNNFIREAQQIAQLDHPAIVRVMQVFEANNTAYMVMPYYTGEPLKRFQKRTNKRWNEAELNALLEPLLNALELLHRQNILHRDIAPDNIFLKDNGLPILIDFGAAKHIESEQTQRLNLLYKHGYSPIEHYSLSGKSQAGSWTDIYSLAAVVYELATGKKVHPAPDRANDDQMHSLKDCHPVGLSANFIASIDIALAIKGKDRPRSISEWRECMKTGKLPNSNTETTPTRFNFKILGSGLLIVGLAYSVFIGYSAWQQHIKTAVEQPAAKTTVEKTQTTAELTIEADKKRSDTEQEQARLAEQTAQQSKANVEETRLKALQQAKAQLKGEDKTLWRAAIAHLDNLEPLDGEAMFLLGASYAKGEGGIKQDVELACQWFNKAADAGDQNGKQYADSKLCKKS